MKWPRIVEVENAPTPVVVYEDEDGELIVEVDADLKGRERASAIIAAVRSHKRNFGSLILLPIALYAWEPIKYATRQYPGAALSTTAASVGLITTAAVLPVAQIDSTPPLAASPPPRTVVATVTETSSPGHTLAAPSVTPSSASPSVRRTPRTPREIPSAVPTRVAPVSTRAPAPKSTRRPTTRPSRHREPERSATPRASASKPTGPEATSPPAGAADIDTTPTQGPDAPTASPPDPGTVDTEETGQAVPDPVPQPPPDRDCLIEVNLDPLANVCVG